MREGVFVMEGGGKGGVKGSNQGGCVPSLLIEEENANGSFGVCFCVC